MSTVAASGPLSIGIGIATAGRTGIAERCLELVGRQTRLPDSVIVCQPRSHDSEKIRLPSEFDVKLIEGPRGSSHQRNRIIAEAGALDILLFMDDDFVMDADYLHQIEAAFRAHPDVVVATGNVVADGVVGPGLSFEEANGILAALPPPGYGLRSVYNGYGCNMAVRMEAVRRHQVVFDENLPLYAWLEDVDFSRSLAAAGRIVQVQQARGVHLGTKSGRQSGRRLGYSQIANPCYLMRKGTCSIRKGLGQMGRNVAANLYGWLRGDMMVDRRGRLSGNARALVDILFNRLAPSRILAIPTEPFAGNPERQMP